MSETLHVGNVGTDLSDTQLRDLFTGSGPVLSARVMRDAGTDVSRGFGLVEMETHEGGQGGIRSVHGQTVGGRRLTVRVLPPRMTGWEGGNEAGGGNRSHGLGTGNGGSRW